MDDRTFDRISRGLAGKTSRRQAFKLLGGGIAAGALGTVGLSQVATAQTNPLTVPIAGTGVDGGSFLGTFTLDRVIARAGELFGLGTLAGTVTRPNDTTQEISRAVQMPLAVAATTCTILDLTLGPLDLNLLGLRIQLDEVNLLITAITGSLLGDLLCAVAGLLSGGPTNALVRLLNQILGALGA